MSDELRHPGVTKASVLATAMDTAMATAMATAWHADEAAMAALIIFLDCLVKDAHDYRKRMEDGDMPESMMCRSMSALEGFCDHLLDLIGDDEKAIDIIQTAQLYISYASINPYQGRPPSVREGGSYEGI